MVAPVPLAAEAWLIVGVVVPDSHWMNDGLTRNGLVPEALFTWADTVPDPLAVTSLISAEMVPPPPPAGVAHAGAPETIVSTVPLAPGFGSVLMTRPLSASIAPCTWLEPSVGEASVSLYPRLAATVLSTVGALERFSAVVELR